MHILENNELRVTIADQGAELTSVIDKSTGLERIWTADPAIWNRHAPILFPFVGKVLGGKYRVNGQEYSMKTQHGFARDLTFLCDEAAGNHVTHSLTDSEKTRENYPYAFSLQVTHALDSEDSRALHIGWKVKNTGSDRMFFSIGGHPGFLMPPNVKKEECFITFPGNDTLRYFSASKDGFAIPGRRHALELKNGSVRYGEDIPDTWIFDGNQVKTVGITLPNFAPYVTLRCEQFPLLAVWANPKGNFICLEPWFGRTDDEGFNGTLEEKAGMEQLAPGESKEFEYSILFHAV